MTNNSKDVHDSCSIRTFIVLLTRHGLLSYDRTQGQGLLPSELDGYRIILVAQNLLLRNVPYCSTIGDFISTRSPNHQVSAGYSPVPRLL